MKKSNLLTKESDWSLEFIEKSWRIIDSISKKYGWKGYEPQFEIVSSEQMLDRYSSRGLPNMYYHWSFGKSRITDENDYYSGTSNLAYEMIINSDPAICYLLEDNSACLQLLTMCHAAVGHSYFFKSNYLFKEWTNPKVIIDYIIFAREFIKKCEESYGLDEVEAVLNSCHTIRNYGVFKYKHQEPKEISEENRQKDINFLWNSLIKKKKENNSSEKSFYKDILSLEENILYFIEKHSFWLKPWQREIVRIVRKLEQYFYPQRQTKLMNEGFAAFVHYTLMYDLYTLGYINEGQFLEFLSSHTAVLYQRSALSKKYKGLNPYSLGFYIFRDIKRVCETPDEEDKKLFPDLIGKNWVEVINNIVCNYNDSSFILQFLSPKVIRQFKLFSVSNKTDDVRYYIKNIQEDSDFFKIRSILSKQYSIEFNVPILEIISYNVGNRVLNLKHKIKDNNLLDEISFSEVLLSIVYLMGGIIRVESGEYIYEGLYDVTEGDFLKNIIDKESGKLIVTCDASFVATTANRRKPPQVI